MYDQSFHYHSYRLLQQGDRTTLPGEHVLILDNAQAVRLRQVDERRDFRDRIRSGGSPSLGAEHT
jgi:hypothetical protein